MVFDCCFDFAIKYIPWFLAKETYISGTNLLNKLKTYLITKHNMDIVVYPEETPNFCRQRNK
jgi:hypothetical protein